MTKTQDLNGIKQTLNSKKIQDELKLKCKNPIFLIENPKKSLLLTINEAVGRVTGNIK